MKNTFLISLIKNSVDSFFKKQWVFFSEYNDKIEWPLVPKCTAKEYSINFMQLFSIYSDLSIKF